MEYQEGNNENLVKNEEIFPVHNPCPNYSQSKICSPPSAFLNHNTFYVYYRALRSWMLVQSALSVGGARLF